MTFDFYEDPHLALDIYLHREEAQRNLLTMGMSEEAAARLLLEAEETATANGGKPDYRSIERRIALGEIDFLGRLR